MADQNIKGPMARLLTGLQGQSYGAKVLGVYGSPPDVGVPANISITWDGTQTGANETDAAAYILTFSWPPNGTEKVAAYSGWLAETFGAMVVVGDALARVVTVPSWAGTIIQTEAAKFVAAHDKDAPTNTVPGAQTAILGALTFSSANSNQIQITDAAVGSNPVRITLNVAHGVLTLASTTGLTFTTGDGTADPSMVFTGTVTNVNTALATIVYAADVAFSGVDTLVLSTEDQGNTTYAVNQFDTDQVSITV